MEATDVTRLELPAEVLQAIGADRTTSVVEQAINVDLDWWNARLRAYGLPGGPMNSRGDDGGVIESGIIPMTRGDVFEIASADLSSADNACRLLWYSLAWGAGAKRRLCDKRLQGVRDGGSRVLDGLVDAARLSSSDAEAAYLAICPSTKLNLVRYLGPAFATKYLYFSGAGAEDHPSLILDSVVATSLRDRCGWESLSNRGGWPSDTYDRYCNLLARWSRESSARPGPTFTADQIERALFALG